MDAQLKKGVLELCLLQCLSGEPKYGYDVIQTMRDCFPDVTESTFYAILRRLAKEGAPRAFAFARPHVEGEFDYSFSGLKTSFLYTLRDAVKQDADFVEHHKADLCASLQRTIVDILLDKLIRASKQTGIRDIAIAGGVSANSGLRDGIVEAGRRRGWRTFLPEFRFTTDNAAMIAVSGYYRYMDGRISSLDISPVARLSDL